MYHLLTRGNDFLKMNKTWESERMPRKHVNISIQTVIKVDATLLGQLVILFLFANNEENGWKKTKELKNA